MPENAANIHFVINPVSGASPAPFHEFGQAMAEAECKTTMHLTKASHSATDCVQDALSAGADLVVAYGGDGTIMEVANALHGKNIPMAIVPGGTANVIAHELNIPQNPKQALDLIFKQEHELRWIDAGLVNGQHFLLRMSIGWEAELSQRPSREEKSTWGTLAYTRAALEALSDLEPVTYQITLDDDSTEEVTGINCSICNIGNVGLYGINIGIGIVPDDDYLNVLILQSQNIQAMLDIVQNLLASSSSLDVEERLLHYKAKKITVSPSQTQRMSYDGEVLEADFPISVSCVPHYISILTPKAEEGTPVANDQ